MKRLRGLPNFKRLSFAQILIFTVAVVLLVTQIERFVNERTLFGYSFYSATRKATPKELSNANGNKQRLCQKVPAVQVEKLTDTPANAHGGLGDFGSSNDSISNCTYTPKASDSAKFKTIYIAVVKKPNEESAKASFQTIKNRSKTEIVNDIKDEAIFNPANSTLTARDGERIATISVNKATESAVDSRAVASQLARLALR